MTATSSFTVDTNILIYANDRSNLAKQHVSGNIVAALIKRGGYLPLQCLNEFYSSTTRKRILSSQEAANVVLQILDLVVPLPVDPADLIAAMDTHRLHGIQFYDALMLATAARSGCATIFSEDFQQDRTFGTITIRNPFTMPDVTLAALLT